MNHATAQMNHKPAHRMAFHRHSTRSNPLIETLSPIHTRTVRRVPKGHSGDEWPYYVLLCELLSAAMPLFDSATQPRGTRALGLGSTNQTRQPSVFQQQRMSKRRRAHARAHTSAMTVAWPMVTCSLALDGTGPLKKRILSTAATAPENEGTVPGAACSAPRASHVSSRHTG